MTRRDLLQVRRRSDGELEDFVAADGDAWLALTVFGGELGRVATADEARTIVHRRGLSSLAERWWWRPRGSDAWQVVVPLEAHAGRVRVAIGYYSLPGVETVTITTDDLAAGDRLTLERPDGAEVDLPT